MKRFAFEFVAAVKPCAELVQVGRAVEISYRKRGKDGEEHGDDGVDAQQRQHDQQRKRNQRIAVYQARRFKLAAEGFDAVQIVGGNIGQEPQHQCRADEPRGNGGVHHVFDVFEQINADDGGGNARGIG